MILENNTLINYLKVLICSSIDRLLKMFALQLISHSRIKVVWILSLVFVMAIPLISSAADNLPGIREIVGAWKTREQRINSVKFEWITDFRAHERAETYHSIGMAPPDGLSDGDESKAPDVQIAGRPVSFIFDGEKYRYNTFNLSLVGSPSSAGGEYDTAYDGILNQRYTKDDSVAFGDIKSTKEFEEINSIYLMPLLLSMRPIKSGIFMPLRDNAKVHKEFEYVGEVRCARIDIEHFDDIDKIMARRSVYVDIARGYIPMRYTQTYGEYITVNVNIKYLFDEEFGWLPSDWSTAMHDAKGKLTEAAVSSVEQYEINPELPQETFRIKFSKGTIIVDQNRGSEKFKVNAEGNLEKFVPKR